MTSWPFLSSGAEEVHVDAEGLVANLDEHVLVIAQLAVDPLSLDHRGRVVFDAFDVVDAVVGPTQAWHQGMLVGIALGQDLSGSVGTNGGRALSYLILRFLLGCLGGVLRDVERCRGAGRRLSAIVLSDRCGYHQGDAEHRRKMGNLPSLQITDDINYTPLPIGSERQQIGPWNGGGVRGPP